jgi:geranylgeranyl diphosphate synthase, type II
MNSQSPFSFPVFSFPPLLPTEFSPISTSCPDHNIKIMMKIFEDFVQHYLAWLQTTQHRQDLHLVESIAYSLHSGGKRFRPCLGLHLCDFFQKKIQDVLPWLLSIEMIHTYSLIHDDLPIMDNDDYRRGKPTNHKVFGEDSALLAGDSLISEAFLLLATHYQQSPILAVELIQDLALAIGPQGMIQGQALDLLSKKISLKDADLLKMHQLKTGSLIWVTLKGVGKILMLTPSIQETLSTLGHDLGLAFQLQDDLTDSEDHLEPGSLPHCIGIHETQLLLNKTHKSIQDILEKLGASQSSLRSFIDFSLVKS